MRDAFAVPFFVSVGMLLEPGLCDERAAPHPLRPRRGAHRQAAGGPGTRLLWGYPAGVALRIAVALAQIGEFSFIVAAVGAQLGLVTDDVRNTLIATAIISIAVNPLLYRAVRPLERWVPQRRTAADTPAEAPGDRRPVDDDPRHARS